MYYDFDENEILEEGLFSDIKDKIHLYSSVKQLQKNVMSTSADHMSNRTDTNIELMGGGPEGIPFGNKLIIENGYITIKNINFVKFFQRIKVVLKNDVLAIDLCHLELSEVKSKNFNFDLF